ncbi:MAG: radical SAM protein [Desulfomonilia bacterium]|jgi:pyruvate formate-lyase activating enzyme-like uncharacterized protein|nr:radical SAM protein [Deltaproteobacteria bacterium]HPX18603.1 radical SAM protein [Deltaproteobacteria bacterium]HRS54985.1 radical SAM protein [Desulfomonilia bacterium]HRV34261.1 radical SAM protein [Desulfomonilia bacterium]
MGQIPVQLTEFDHQGLVEKTRRDCACFYDRLRWITPADALRFEHERRELLDALSPQALFAFNGTKPYIRRLSPGCRLCGEGSWSCLFINNICNARCFYCPSEQQAVDEPGTNTLTFRHPEDYADYLEYFGFKGASISGGEPFLTFDRTLAFAREIKRRFQERIYLWLYTNGILATPDMLAQLRDTGLDEIRYNIGAAGFSLEHVQRAVGVIPHVTIEIPAVPERLDLLIRLIPEMRDRGVDFLNLHQIRCTAFNHSRLASRGYTFVHGPFTGVAESEITALKLLVCAANQGIDLGVNYCSLIYRHRFQTRAFRRSWARHLKKNHEDVTDTGMIRSMSQAADPDLLQRIQEACAAGKCDGASFLKKQDRLFFSRTVMDLMDGVCRDLRVSYHLPSIHPAVTYRNAFKEIRLDSGKTVVLERSPATPEIELSPEEAAAFRVLTAANAAFPEDLDGLFRLFPGIGRTSAAEERWKTILQAERIRSGLLEYY